MKKFICVAMGTALATTAAAVDLTKREILSVPAEQRLLVLAEMNALLKGTQEIVAALARDDFAAAAEHARAVGMGMMKKSEDHLHGALPEAFMQLGMSVHREFDVIAADAEELRDSAHTLQQLGETMNKCVACHATYELRVSEAAPAHEH